MFPNVPVALLTQLKFKMPDNFPFTLTDKEVSIVYLQMNITSKADAKKHKTEILTIQKNGSLLPWAYPWYYLT